MLWLTLKGILFGIFGLYSSFAIIAFILIGLSVLVLNASKTELACGLAVLFMQIVGAFCWGFFGMYFAVLAYQLTSGMKLWLAIIITSFIIILAYRETKKITIDLLQKKSPTTRLRLFIDDNGSVKSSEYSQHLVGSFFVTHIFIIISYIFFLIFPSYANVVTFGLSDAAISIII